MYQTLVDVASSEKEKEETIQTQTVVIEGEENDKRQNVLLNKACLLILWCLLFGVVYRQTCPGECEYKCQARHFETAREMILHLLVIVWMGGELNHFAFLCVPIGMFVYAPLTQLEIFQVGLDSFPAWSLVTKILVILVLLFLLLAIAVEFFFLPKPTKWLMAKQIVGYVALCGAGFSMQTCVVHFHHKNIFFLVALCMRSATKRAQIVKGIALGIFIHGCFAYSTIAMFGDGSCDCCTQYQCCLFGSCHEAQCARQSSFFLLQ